MAVEQHAAVSHANIRVASLIWNTNSQLHEAQAEVVESLGYAHEFFQYNESIPIDAEIILVQGPYGSLQPLVRRLLEREPCERPVLVYWFQQSMLLYNDASVQAYLARAFSDLSRIGGESGPIGTLIGKIPTLRSRGNRLRYLTDILWLNKHGLLDVLALSSTVYAHWLRNHGIASLVVPRGYHPSYGTILNRKRDIAVVWMGKPRTRRRREAIYWLQEQLRRRGQTMVICDNEQHNFVFGDERTHLLNRAYFMLNLLSFAATDELSIRYYIAGANGTVTITEPGANDYPFVPGEHIVECPTREMPDRIMYYLEHVEEWERISRNLVTLMQEDLTLKCSVASILAAAHTRLQARPRCAGSHSHVVHLS